MNLSELKAGDIVETNGYGKALVLSAENKIHEDFYFLLYIKRFCELRRLSVDKKGSDRGYRDEIVKRNGGLRITGIIKTEIDLTGLINGL